MRTNDDTNDHDATSQRIAVLLAESQLAVLSAALRPLVTELVASLIPAAGVADPADVETWLTPAQAASRAGVHRRTIYRALSAGTLPGGRVVTTRGPSRWRIRPADVNA